MVGVALIDASGKQYGPQSYTHRRIHTHIHAICVYADKLIFVVGVALIDAPGKQHGPSRLIDAPGKQQQPAGGRPAPRVLLAQRPPGKANAGLWEFPGGKVSEGCFMRLSC